VSAQDAVDDAGRVEAGDDRQAAGYCGGLEAPDVLQPAQVQLQIVALGRQRRELPGLAPAEEHSQVGLGVLARGAAVARQVGNAARPSSRDWPREAVASIPTRCSPAGGRHQRPME